MGATQRRPSCGRVALHAMVWACALCALASRPAGAQTRVVRDGTIGPGAGVQPVSVPTPTGVEVQIDESLGLRDGESLFHSFQFFDVGSGDGVHFSADPGLQTDQVISRVTGGDASAILGRIRSSVPGADVYLLNPAGVILGEGASLDVDGSFYATTADRLALGEDGFFSANPAAPSLLSSAPPSAFGFFAGNDGMARAEGADLSVQGGQALWLAGADAAVGTGGVATSLSSAGGGVVLLGTGGNAVQVQFDPDDPTAEPGLDADLPGGTVTVGDAGVVSTAGSTPGSVQVVSGDVRLDGVLSAESLGAGSGGAVRVRAIGALDVGGHLSADALDAGDAGEVRVEGDPDAVLAGGALLSARSAPAPGAGGSGEGGLVHLEVGRLDAQPGARVDVSSASDSSGDAGRVRIESRGRVRFTGTGSGGLDLAAGAAQVADSGIVAASLGAGSAGSVEVTGRNGRADAAPPVVLRDGAVVSAASASGPGGGGVSIEARRIAVRSGSLLDATTLEGEQGGDIALSATEKIAVRGRGADDAPSQVRAVTAGPGGAGSIRLAAPRVELTDGGRLSTVSIPAAGDGDAGAIEVRAGTLRMREGAVVDSSTFGDGRAGEIRLTGFDGDRARRVVVTGAGTLVTGRTAGTGAGSEVLAQADRIRVRDGGTLSTRSAPGLGATGAALGDLADEAVGGSPLSDTLALLDDPGRDAPGEGGLLRLRAGSSVAVRGGRIESVARGSGDAGRIAIESPRVRLDRGARITASTEAGGTGGRITVDGVERFRMADGSAIEATSLAAPGPDDPGDAGAIRIDGAPASDFVVADSRIETTAVGSGGGFIGMGANDATLLLDDAAIRTDVLSGDRQAGTIVIRGQTLVTRGGEIVARAAEGQGGAIEILVSDFRPGDDTLIASTSDAGFDGPVRVRSPETLVATNRVIPLEPEFLDPIDLLRRDCQAPGDPGAGGSFTVGANRGRADAMPVAWAPAAGAPPAEAAVETSMPWRHALAARAAADAGRRSEALAQLASLAEETEALDDARERVRLAIHAAGTWAALAQESSGERAASGLLRAHDALRDAARLAAASDDERGRALALGHLAELYRREARFDEALFLARRAEAAAERSDRDPNRYRWSWLQGRIEWERGHSGEAIAAFGRAVAVLERESPQARRFRRDVAPLYLDWVDALLHSAARVQDPDARARLLLRARDSMERLKVAELRDYYRDECVADLKAKTLPLDAVSERAAIVYPVPLRDRLELLVSVGGHIERYATPVTSDEVVATALRFRQGVENRLSVEYIETGKVLYDWFVRPYAEALRARGVDTLVFVPDGIVGAVPFAALRGDGGVLIDQFAVAVTPGLSLVDPRPLPHERLEPLLVGLSQPAEGLPALASVAGELGDIHALHGGEVLLDEDFERARLAREVASQRPAVLHIASHAVFTGDPATSFVLAHDGRIPLESLAAVVGQNRFRDDPVELLILSACETAAGDQHAALGLAGMAVRAGARSAVGSLWSIDDAAAREFVVEFYRQLLVPDVGRAEALRRAQLRLRSDERYTHPYYWSAFLMISDWQ